jgi:malonyl-CoA O-methyltransferase
MPSDSDFSLDRPAQARAFDRAAAGYDASFEPLQRMNAELLERLKYFSLNPQSILDLGAGTCSTTSQLRQRYPRAQVLALDSSLAMLQHAQRSWWRTARYHRVVAEAAQLPLRDHSVDLVYSNLLLPFCDRPHLVFRELARVLREGGLFVFSSLGPDTLMELRQAWRSVDDHEHVSQFLNLPQLGDALMQSGLIEPVMDTEHHTLSYPDAHALMRDLKRLGAQNAVTARFRGITGRTRLQRMAGAYETARLSTGLPATFEVIFGAAFAAGSAAAGGHQPGLGSGEAVFPLSSLQKRSR